MNPVAGGAAEKAAVCQGDRLVWIDGAMVSDLTHSALSKMVCGLFVTVFIDFCLGVMQQIIHQVIFGLTIISPYILLQMKKCGDHITILVIDSESEKKYTQRRLPVLPTMATPHQLPYRARTLHLVSVSESFGFLLRLEKVPSGRTCEMMKNC